ncbi:MAG: hypothetical protein MUO77_16880 [Anaerolineales bacterium]|nr:hypothetical protein [Anaerolineales bacterium]
MKTSRLFLALAVLVLASLACQAIGGGSSTEAPSIPSSDNGGSGDAEAPTVEDSGGGDSSTGNADFPMPSDASNVMEVGNGVLTFQTKSTLDECMAFYRDKFGGMGYTEREILTNTTEMTFSIVFDGHESGEAIVVQGVDLGNGLTNISVRLEDA